jgi:hypothetical protein
MSEYIFWFNLSTAIIFPEFVSDLIVEATKDELTKVLKLPSDNIVYKTVAVSALRMYHIFVLLLLQALQLQ